MNKVLLQTENTHLRKQLKSLETRLKELEIQLVEAENLIICTCQTKNECTACEYVDKYYKNGARK